MRCCSAIETEQHMLFDCPYAQKIWRATGISSNIINGSYSTLEEKIEACLTCNRSSSLAHIKDLPIYLLWRIWKSRNMMMFQQRNIQWWSVIHQANADAAEWSKYSQEEVYNGT